MTDLNTVILIGRITRDLDDKSFGYVGNGNARASVSIAVNRSVKKGDTWEDEASFIDVTIWGKTAENLQPYLTKGRQVVIKGYLKQDRWEKDGEKKSRLSVVADNVQLIGGKDSDPKGDDPRTIQKKAAFKPLENMAQELAQAVGGEIVSGEEFPEDIPF